MTTPGELKLNLSGVYAHPSNGHVLSLPCISYSSSTGRPAPLPERDSHNYYLADEFIAQLRYRFQPRS